MSDDRKDVKRQEKAQSRSLSPIFWPVKTVFKLFSMMIYSLLFAVIIEFIGMTFFWEADHAKGTFVEEIAYLGEHFSTTVLGYSAYDLAMKVVNTVSSYIVFDPSIDSPFIVAQWLNVLGQYMQSYVSAFIYIVLTMTIRVMVIILSCASFLIVFLATAADGLVEREIRKAEAGIERGYVFHASVLWVSRAMTISPVLYLSWPDSINPNYVLLPGLALFGLSIYMSFASFKKYI